MKKLIDNLKEQLKILGFEVELTNGFDGKEYFEDYEGMSEEAKDFFGPPLPQAPKKDEEIARLLMGIISQILSHKSYGMNFFSNLDKYDEYIAIFSDHYYYNKTPHVIFKRYTSNPRLQDLNEPPTFTDYAEIDDENHGVATYERVELPGKYVGILKKSKGGIVNE
ncbi:MAG: hypothetical protein Q4B80_01675 [Aerococcaceae bacterium]|nr:hypothetical protein [Aerococcaceae bacterium]